MGKPNLLSCLEKRDMLNSSAVSADRLVEWGRTFEEQEQINDAIDFYIKAGSSDALQRLIPAAIEDGDVFLYTRLTKALRVPVSAGEWIALGNRAAELGKDAYAREAFRKGGVETERQAETQGEPAPEGGAKSRPKPVQA